MSAALLTNAYVRTRQGQLHTRSVGEGPTVVALQILPFGTQALDGLLSALAAAGFRALAFDLMGYGRSSPRTRAWSVEEFAADLGEGLAVLDLMPRAVISGHFTGMVATELALTAPERIGRLIVDGVALWPREIAAERLRTAKPREPFDRDGETLKRAWASVVALMKRFDPDLDFAPERQDALFRAFAHFTEIGLGPDATSAIMRYDLAEALGRLRAPTLIIGSPTDSLRHNHEAALELAPHAEDHLFDTVHPLYRFGGPDRAADYVAVIAPFLSREG